MVFESSAIRKLRNRINAGQSKRIEEIAFRRLFRSWRRYSCSPVYLAGTTLVPITILLQCFPYRKYGRYMYNLGEEQLYFAEV